MKAVVIGGGGHVGNAFVRTLLKADYDVVAVGRSADKPFNLNDTPAMYQALDDRELQLDEVCAGASLIVDAAASYALGGADQPVALQRGESLLEICRQHRARLIHVGSFTTRVQPANLTGQALARLHPYFALKRALEDQVLASDVDAVILNPTQCIGPWDMKPLALSLIPLLMRGAIPFTANQRVNTIDVRDVAAAGLAAIRAEQFREPILLSGHNTTLDALFGRIARLAESTPPDLHVSAQLGALIAFGLEQFGPWVPEQLRYPSLGPVLLLCQQWLFPSPAQRQQGLSSTSLSKSLVDSIRWYASRPDLASLPAPSGCIA